MSSEHFIYRSWSAGAYWMNMMFRMLQDFPFRARQKRDEKLFKGNAKGGTTAKRKEKNTNKTHSFIIITLFQLDSIFE